MATMVPELSDTQLRRVETRSRAEARLYRACREQLDSNYLVLYSLSLVVEPGAWPDDAEADFVIFDRRRGMLVVEVKGGGIRFDPGTGIWQSQGKSGTHDIHDPFKQAMKVKRGLIPYLRNHKKWKSAKLGWLLAGHAVFLPDTSNVERLCLPEAPVEIIGSKEHLANLDGWLQTVLNYWQGEGETGQPLGPKGIDTVMDILCPQVQVRPLIGVQLAEEERDRIRLTDKQARIFQVIGDREEAVICGGAGTGKTLLAMERARQLAGKGLSALLLCYNKILAEHLKDVAGNQPGLMVMGFHEFCGHRVAQVQREKGIDLLAEAKRAWPNKDLYHCHLPFALARSAEVLGDTFDAIIVDEGQDFLDEYWLGIEMLRSPAKGYFYVFYDCNQAIYTKPSQFLQQKKPFYLTENCRNTSAIHETVYRYYRGPTVYPPDIDGWPVEFITSPSPPSQSHKVHSLIERLLLQEGLKPKDIALLVASSSASDYFPMMIDRPLPNGARYAQQEHGSDNTIFMDWFGRFKGMEANILVYWACRSATPEAMREEMYVGLSRCKSRLFIVGSDEVCRRIQSVQ